ncbi:hypothetical protein GCM10009111_14080 [Colwellia asteriadis]|uniref:Acylneuraminate cytidylyltransferase n=1 Tax=Colwellia asteriadis TaxID=517723 RepID=A0ABN1L5T0_9GAMM
MFAYIPARIGSTRIKKKNIRLLDGKPVICHVIENLLNTSGLQGIAISTDSQEIKDIADKYTGVTTLSLRNKKISNNSSNFMDLVKQDLPRFQQHFSSDDVLFTLATSALISSHYFQQGIDSFTKQSTASENSSSLVMSVREIGSEALLGMIQTTDGSISPLFPNNFNLPTADLPKLFTDAGGFYIFNADQARQYKMLIDLKPIQPVFLPDNIGVDVDIEEDWQKLTDSYFKTKGLV